MSEERRRRYPHGPVILWLRHGDEVSLNEGVQGGPLWEVAGIARPARAADGALETALRLVREPPGDAPTQVRTLRGVRAFDGFWISEAGDVIRLFNLDRRELPRHQGRAGR